MELGFRNGLEMYHNADLPARSGLDLVLPLLLVSITLCSHSVINL